VPEIVQAKLDSHVKVYVTQIQETFNNATAWVEALLSRYISELNHICVSHTISSESSERVSEVEVMLGTNLEPSSEGRDLVERMKRLTDDLTSFVRSELQGEEDGSRYEWLGRTWKAYMHTSDLGDERFGAFSFSWIALGSVFEALNALDESFLPDLDPIDVAPILDTHDADPSDTANPESAAFDLDNWTWDDDPQAGGVANTDSSQGELLWV
jgi:hypothetical protein